MAPPDAAKPPAPFGAERETVDAARYTSAEFARLERERLWPRAWLLACHEGDVREPGDFAAFEFGGESLVVVRGRDGALGAFHNVCMHRGQRLVPCGLGRRERLVCGYHGWEWGLDGRLLKAHDAGRFPYGVPEDRRRLAAVACEAWGGFVWVHLGEPEQSLRAWLGPVVDQVAPYRPEEFRVVNDTTSEWPCNWKLAVDAFSETYHLPSVHPETLDYLNPTETRLSYYDLHSRLELTIGNPAPGGGRHGKLDGMLREFGLSLASFGGDAAAARAALQQEWRRLARRGGVDYAGLTEDQLVDTNQYLLFPNVHYDFHGANRLTIFRYRPHATDPERCYFDLIDLERATVLGEKRARPAHAAATDEELTLTVRQDAVLLKELQKGMRSSAYPGHLLHAYEGRILAFHRLVDRYLARPPGA